MNELVVRDNPEELRYEALRDGQLVGIVRYRVEPGVVVLVHTEVDEAVEGTGVGSQLVRGALDDLRARGLGVVPVCPFVAAFLRRQSGVRRTRRRRPGDARVSEPAPEHPGGPHSAYANDADRKVGASGGGLPDDGLRRSAARGSDRAPRPR